MWGVGICVGEEGGSSTRMASRERGRKGASCWAVRVGVGREKRKGRRKIARRMFFRMLVVFIEWLCGRSLTEEIGCSSFFSGRSGAFWTRGAAKQSMLARNLERSSYPVVHGACISSVQLYPLRRTRSICREKAPSPSRRAQTFLTIDPSCDTSLISEIGSSEMDSGVREQ